MRICFDYEPCRAFLISLGPVATTQVCTVLLVVFHAPSPSLCSGSVCAPKVFGPTGSGSLHHKAKIVQKTLISTVCDFFMTIYLYKNDVNVPSKCNKQKNEKKSFLLASDERAGSGSGVGSVSPWYGSEYPDLHPYQNVTDPEH
jgi:hypothetical protein